MGSGCISDNNVEDLKLARSEIRKELTEDKKIVEDKNNSRFSFESIRSWTNGQVMLFRTLMFSLLVFVAKAAFFDTNGELASNRWVNYLEIAILIVIIYFSYDFEKRNNRFQDTREEEKRTSKTQKVAQLSALIYIFDQILPDDDLRIEEKLNILKRVPEIVQQVSVSEVNRQIQTGFELMADTMTSIGHVVEDKKEYLNQQIKNATSSAIDEILVTLGIKKTIPRTVNDEDLEDKDTKKTVKRNKEITDDDLFPEEMKHTEQKKE